MESNKTNLKISFCLPVYNVKEYLTECINSIISQKLKERDCYFEILCIDDASTDGSYNKLKEIEKKHSDIRVLRNDTNKGVSFTRNRLICEARGKYIWFVDPDDMLYPNIAFDFFELAENNKADVVLGDYIRFTDNNEISSSLLSENEKRRSANQKDFLPSDKSGKKMCTVCAGIFNRDFLLKNELKFNEEMIAQEDTLFYYEFSLKAVEIIKCDFPCYFYRQRATSVMHKKSEKRAKEYYKSMFSMLNVYTKHLKENDYDDITILNKKIHQSKENIAFCLAMITDTKYVRTELKRLKKDKIYPYPFRKNALKSNEVYLLRVFRWLLPVEPMFWIFHFACITINKYKYKKSNNNG